MSSLSISPKGPIHVLHLGLGRFHRAHQAVYYQNLFENTGELWTVAAVSMRSAEARDHLRKVQHRYPVVMRGQGQTHLQWISCLQESYFAKDPEDQKKIFSIFSSEDLQLVTLTVTEKAYTLGAEGETLLSLLYEGLKHRKEMQGKPLTVLSCDNLRGNGHKLQELVLEYCSQKGDSETKSWIQKNISFPCSMVDRIVPALTEEKLHELQKEFGLQNPELVATEVFSQWVIEDHFKSQKPSLEKVGAQFVHDVTPYEEMKLRLLNASHSFLAYSGLLKDYQTVDQAIRDSELRQEVLKLYQEVIPLLKIPSGFNVDTYIQSLLQRFDNPRLPHQLKQIAMDGSQKLPQRILPSLKLARAKKSSSQMLETAIDRWAQYCYKVEPDDPLKNSIQNLKKEYTGFDAFKKALFQKAFPKDY